MGYLCANFSLLSLSDLKLDPMYATGVRRQTDKRQTKATLNSSALWGEGVIIGQKSMAPSEPRMRRLTELNASSDVWVE